MRRSILLFTTALMLGSTLASAAPEAFPVALVLAVRGKCQIVSGEESRTLKVMARLQADDRIVLTKPEEAVDVVIYSTREQLRLTGPCKVRLLAGGGTAETGAAPVRVRIHSPALVPPGGAAGRRIAGSVSRPADKLTAPFPKGAVRPGALVFKWTNGLPTGAKDVELHLEIVDGEDVLHEASLPLGTSEYRVPKRVQLVTGQSYLWSVEVTGKGVGAHRCEAEFWLLTAPEAARLPELDRERQLLLDKAPEDAASYLLLSHAYEQLGLLADCHALLASGRERFAQDSGFVEEEARLRRLLALPQPEKEDTP